MISSSTAALAGIAALIQASQAMSILLAGMSRILISCSSLRDAKFCANVRPSADGCTEVSNVADASESKVAST